MMISRRLPLWTALILALPVFVLGIYISSTPRTQRPPSQSPLSQESSPEPDRLTHSKRTQLDRSLPLRPSSPPSSSLLPPSFASPPPPPPPPSSSSSPSSPSPPSPSLSSSSSSSDHQRSSVRRDWSGVLDAELPWIPEQDGVDPSAWFLRCVQASPRLDATSCGGQSVCDLFPYRSGVSRPNTYVGRVLYCMGSMPPVWSMLEAGTELASGTRMMALGAEDAQRHRHRHRLVSSSSPSSSSALTTTTTTINATSTTTGTSTNTTNWKDNGNTTKPVVSSILSKSMSILNESRSVIYTIEVQRSRQDAAREKWGARFPSIHWITGGTVDSPKVKQCLMRWYSIPEKALAIEPLLAKLCREQNFDGVFLDTTSCTGPSEIDAVMENSNAWFLILHDWGDKYSDQSTNKYKDWKKLGIYRDSFNCFKDYCQCNGSVERCGSASVAVFFSLSRYQRQMEKRKEIAQ